MNVLAQFEAGEEVVGVTDDTDLCSRDEGVGDDLKNILSSWASLADLSWLSIVSCAPVSFKTQHHLIIITQLVLPA